MTLSLLASGAPAAHAATPETQTCLDGPNPAGVTGYQAASGCATTIATLQARGCTVTHSDDPDGNVDTLTVDCGNRLVRRTSSSNDRPALEIRPWQGDGSGKTGLGKRVSTEQFPQMTCYVQVQGVIPAVVERQAKTQCVQQLTQKVNAYSAEVFADSKATWNPPVKVSTRCEKAEVGTNVVYWTNGLGIPVSATATAEGSVDCYAVIYGGTRRT